MSRVIHTIGYEGSDIQKFIATLKSKNIDLIIDVRELPLSRKKGFSKNSLALHLQANDINYVHLKGLGDPKPGRMAARSGDYKLFEKIFSKHMQSQRALEDLDVASKLVKMFNACLLCFECEHDKCHRSIVADMLEKKTHLTIKPLKCNITTIGNVFMPLQGCDSDAKQWNIRSYNSR